MRWSRKRKASGKTQIDDPLQIVHLRLKTCKDALKKNPNDPDALFTQAVFLTRIHEYNRAIESLSKVVDIQPEYPMVYDLMSLVYTRIGDVKRAKECRQKSFSNDKDMDSLSLEE